MAEGMARERGRIARISENDFWTAWAFRERELNQVLEKGGLGKRGYLALARHHARSLASEWAFVQEDARRRNADPKALQKMRACAQDVRRGIINGWHSQIIRFGRWIDFNANFGQSGLYGFHYLGWLVPLIDRFILENEKGDLDRIVDIVRQYYGQRTRIRQRVPGLDPVYYELGAWAKTVHLFPAYLALINKGAPAPRDLEAFLKLFLGFGRSLCRLQQGGFRPGNWQIVGCEALFRLGAVFAELNEARRWRVRASRIMQAHLARDFFSDGGHKERCWSYGWMSLEGMIHYCETAERTRHLPRETVVALRRSMARSFEWFIQTLTPTGICPAYGDGDLSRADEILAEAKRFLSQPQWEAAAKKRGLSLCLKPSGYAFMRDGARKEARYLNLNFGPWGGGHTHQDLLDFNIWAFGEPILEEVGRFDSYDHPFSAFFRSPQAHNQVVIDHQAMQRDKAAGKNIFWRSTARYDYFAASHDGFAAARVCRYVLFKRGAYWLIYDVIQPRKETIFTVSSYLHSPRAFTVLRPGVAQVAGPVGCVIAFARGDGLKRIETGIEIEAGDSEAPRLYPERYYLRARTWADKGYTGCLRFAMLIYPFKGRAPRIALRQAPIPGARPGVLEAFEILTPRCRERVVFDSAARPALSFQPA